MDMSTDNQILVIDYSPEWPRQFSRLADVYQDYLDGLLVGMEHVGSTSVPGLAAKPILDIDLIVQDKDALERVIPVLESLGYDYRGEVGIPDRHVFWARAATTPNDGSLREWPRHHLYCCIKDSAGLRNHLLLRDRLRADAELSASYGALKKELAQQTTDIGEYIEGKTEFITAVLEQGGFDAGELASIVDQNRNVIR